MTAPGTSERRVPHKRADAIPSSPYVMMLAIGLLLGILLAVLAVDVQRQVKASLDAKKPVRSGNPESPLVTTYDYQGEATRYYVMVDPLTGVQYLVNDRGGMCVRSDGLGGSIGGDADE